MHKAKTAIAGLAGLIAATAPPAMAQPAAAAIAAYAAGMNQAQLVDLQDQLKASEQGGWRVLWIGDDRMNLVKPASASASPRLWIRTDFKVAQRNTDRTTFRSSLTLFEFDCAAGRQQVLQVTEFEGPYLGGRQVFNLTSTAPEWSHTTPGSVGELAQQEGCKAATVPGNAAAQPGA